MFLVDVLTICVGFEFLNNCSQEAASLNDACTTAAIPTNVYLDISPLIRLLNEIT